MVGTPNYVASELVDNHVPSEKSDVWAAGCVLYALVSGRPPFHAATVDEVRLNAKRAVYRRLTALSDPLNDVFIK